MEKVKWIRVMGFKHDGSIHRVWDKACKIYEDDEKIMISNAKTLIREHDGRIWMAKEPSMTIYYKHRWFNIIGIIRSEGIHYYCNIASPIIIEDDVIKYIDYDLDLVKTVKGELKVLDEDEYEVNKVKYGYSEELQRVLLSELEKLKEYASKGELDFKDEQVYEGFNTFWDAFMRHEYDNN